MKRQPANKTPIKPILLAACLSLALSHPALAGGGDPVFVTSDPKGGWSNGGYYVHNNMWNASSG